MKLITLSILIYFSGHLFGQVYGDIFMDKRGIEKDITYTIPYSQPGKLVFDIRVNVDGKVTSCILDEEKSTITATHVMMKGKNKIMTNLLFSKGIGYPKFHNGFVQLITVQHVPKGEDKFTPPE